ncbi:MAG: imidazole glycerol phosphate synthase subunit HisH [Firmicutes bacterium]|nr:imidazole glycerol phosphate synthase subunit HisH [Bacillota bacterium]
MIAIVDYGVGNLFSLQASLKYLGFEAKVTGDKNDLKAADRLILPGVGAFEDAMAKLKATGLVDTIIDETSNGKYLLGICLGMQLLFEKSYEYGEHEGLGLVEGDVVSIEDDLSPTAKGKLKVPHIGWNALTLTETGDDLGRDPLFKYTKNGDCVYFVHSFYGVNCEKSTIATTEYDVTVTAAVRNGTVYGTQFHPEKSGKIGLDILKAFTELK